ncbi:IS110 family transposase [Nitrospirillum viridazoti]|uniref:Transposase n=1 Tax=Nitrospirillum amazonense TaxID=28077 RepID=A0A560HX20_9PROT|nr:IS110 family transposase [Nitrospirillum amazonense]TWB50915.1 transposase [Nitrospirillum amazonense]
MVEVSMIGLDLAKSVFQVHGLDAAGQVVLQRRLRRTDVIKFFTKLSACVIGMEACASAHYWARTLSELGHEVRLIPPAHVKPYVKRGRKNDAVDAAAIAEAMARPHMRTVPIKTEEQQAALMLHRVRRLLMSQRTRLSNALRSHFAEFGIIEPAGDGGLSQLITAALDMPGTALPQPAREALALLAAQWRETSAKIDALDQEILAWHRGNADSRRVATIPGMGPLIASAIVATVGDPGRFKTSRQFAAWLGLVPSQHSSGGKTVLGAITKTGDRYLRSLLVVGATSVMARRGKKQGTWLAALLARKTPRQVSVALANKMARTAWAILVKGGTYEETASATVT